MDQPREETVQRARCSQTAKDGRRQNPAIKLARLAATTFLLVTACTQPRPGDLFRSAQTSYKQGKFSEATESAEAGYLLFKNPQSIWHWRFSELAAELQLLNGKTGAADAILATAPPAEFRSLIPRYEMLRGYSLARHKSYSQAEELFKSAIFDAHALGDSETEADSLLQFGMFQLGSHQYDAADTAFRRAQDVSETNHLGYQDAVAINDRGLLQIRRERYADAISLLETARDSASGAGAGFIAALALNNLAVCYENLGDLDRALESQKASVARQEQFGLKTLLSYGYSELGTIFLKKGETSAAIPYFQRAFDAVSQDAPVQYAFSAGNLANVLQQTGSLDRAEQINQIAFKFVDPKNSADLATFTATRAAIAEKRGQHNQAVSHYQEVLSLAKDIPSILWQTYADLAAVYAAQGDFQTADASYSKAISVIAANRADQLKSDYKITFLSNLIHFYQDYVALLMRHGDYDRALEIADSSRASVLTEDLAGNSEPSRSTLIAQMRKAARASHSVFLFYWLAPKQSYLWAITGTACKFYPLADQKQIEQDVTSYRALIEEQKRDPLALASPAGTRLFQELIAPAASLIPKDASVVIVPDGVLHNVNFETLLVSTPTPHYWIEDATITVAPSLSILQAGKSATPTRRSLLIMGNPITQGTGYPDLPEAAAEIANIQRQFPAGDSNILTGAQAVVESYFAAKPAKYSTIHFATHVDANAKSPLDSAIILSPQAGGFRLYARDVAGTPLNADLVTISACRSAGARTLSGEGLVGFAWAFFQAHARNVVTSLWDVSDQSTAQLMEKFYRGVRANHAYAQALREAKLQMLHNSNYKRPYYWAPFQLYSRTL